MTVSVELPKREQWAADRTRRALEQEAGRSATTVGEPQGRRRWKEGSRSGGGLGGHAALLPFAAQAGGQRESSPQPSSHRWALWPVIMVPVAPSCAPPSPLSETNTIRSAVSVFVWESIRTCRSSQLCPHQCLPVQKLIAWKRPGPLTKPGRPGNLLHGWGYMMMFWPRKPWNKNHFHRVQEHWGVWL